MKKQAQKLHQKVKQEFPQASKVVENHIHSKASKKSKVSERSITRREVEILKEWIHRALGN